MSNLLDLIIILISRSAFYFRVCFFGFHLFICCDLPFWFLCAKWDFFEPFRVVLMNTLWLLSLFNERINAAAMCFVLDVLTALPLIWLTHCSRCVFWSFIRSPFATASDDFQNEKLSRCFGDPELCSGELICNFRLAAAEPKLLWCVAL